jgi:hypothetical protein
MTDQDRHLFPESIRPFEEVEGGYFDINCFYVTPNGSFWDDQGYYFNQFGYDVHGGHYDSRGNGIYIPGPGYNPEIGVYEDEIDKDLKIMQNGNKLFKDIILNEELEELEEAFDNFNRVKTFGDEEDSEDGMEFQPYNPKMELLSQQHNFKKDTNKF